MKKRHLKYLLEIARRQRDDVIKQIEPAWEKTRRLESTISQYYDIIQERNKTINWRNRRLRNQASTIDAILPRLRRMRNTIGEYYKVIQARNRKIEEQNTLMEQLRNRTQENCDCRYCATVKEILGG